MVRIKGKTFLIVVILTIILIPCQEKLAIFYHVGNGSFIPASPGKGIEKTAMSAIFLNGKSEICDCGADGENHLTVNEQDHPQR